MWLIGNTTKKLLDSQLPAKRHVLALFGFYHITKKFTRKLSASKTVEDVLRVYSKYGIPTRLSHRLIDNVLKLYNEWLNLKKSKHRITKTEDDKRLNFKENMEAIFEVMHSDAVTKVQCEKIRNFLLQQKNSVRPLKIKFSADRTMKLRSAAEKNRNERQDSPSTDKYENDMIQFSQFSVASTNFSDMSEPEFTVSKYLTKKDMAPSVNVLSHDVTAALDRAQVSDRKASLVLPAVIHAMGQDATNLPVSYSSIRRTRQSKRLEEAARIQNNFVPVSPLTLHWDSKLLPTNSGNKKVDKLPIIVTTATGDEQLLGIATLSRGTGDSISKALHEHVTEWDIVDAVGVMSFDTTSTNTGRKNGACARLQSKINKDLLYFACRHHIYELVLETAFSLCFGPSCGPEPAIFKRFQNVWSDINQLNFKSGMSDPEIASVIGGKCAEMNDFASEMLTVGQPRDDYQELLNLILVFTGRTEVPKFRMPGAMHRARWMAKAIYILKIFLFRNEFLLNSQEEASAKRMCIFLVSVYVFGWYNAPLVIEAPRNDLNFLRTLESFKQIDVMIANAALKKFSRHLWYLSEETICLALFDEKVSIFTKQQILNILNKSNWETLNNCQYRKVGRKIKAEEKISNFSNIELENFAIVESYNFFKILGLKDVSFLKEDIEKWPTNENYVQLRSRIANMKVVNDIAERGVALAQNYNNLLTQSEEQKQALYLTVQQHRKRLPVAKKKDVIKKFRGE